MVEAATRLNAEARAEPGGAANLQLGYLLGAAQRGAEGTEGIHAELIRRLTAAARYSPEQPAAAARPSCAPTARATTPGGRTAERSRWLTVLLG